MALVVFRPITSTPSWNIAPTQDVPIVAERLDDQGELHRWLITGRWGLVPSWAKDIKIGSKPTNVRRETISPRSAWHAAPLRPSGEVHATPPLNNPVPAHKKSPQDRSDQPPSPYPPSRSRVMSL